jgi:hypothetical protein
MWGLRILGLTLLVHCAAVVGIGSTLFFGPSAHASATPGPTPENPAESARHARCLDQEKRDDLARAAVMQKVAPRLIGTDKLSRGKGFITLEEWLAADKRTFDRVCSALLALEDKTKGDSESEGLPAWLTGVIGAVLGAACTQILWWRQRQEVVATRLLDASTRFGDTFIADLRGWASTGFTGADALAEARGGLKKQLLAVDQAKHHWRRPAQLMKLLYSPALAEGDNALWTEQTQAERDRHVARVTESLEMYLLDVQALGTALKHPRPLSFRRSAASYRLALQAGLCEAPPTGTSA